MLVFNVLMLANTAKIAPSDCTICQCAKTLMVQLHLIDSSEQALTEVAEFTNEAFWVQKSLVMTKKLKSENMQFIQMFNLKKQTNKQLKGIVHPQM